MNLAQRFHSEAKFELDATFDWYEDQQRGLGRELLETVKQSIELISEWPEIAPVFYIWNQKPVVRAQTIKRFPYRLFYYVTDSDLMIVAFAHNKRQPGYWRDRV